MSETCPGAERADQIPRFAKSDDGLLPGAPREQGQPGAVIASSWGC